MVATFANGYDGTLPDGTRVEQGMGSPLTLQQIDALTTVRRLHPEVRRRYYGVMLEAFDRSGGVIRPGFGTAWRIQPTNAPGHAEPGNSWHEFVAGWAYAIDTVPASSWDLRDKLIAKYGLINFDKPQTGGVNHTGKAYTGPWDAPHVQAWELNYSRSRTNNPPPLKKWPIQPRYDIDVVGLNFEQSSQWGGTPAPNPPLNPPAAEVPPIVQPTPPDGMIFQPELGNYGLYPLNRNKDILRDGYRGDTAKYFQSVYLLHVTRFARWWVALGGTSDDPARDRRMKTIMNFASDGPHPMVIDGFYGPQCVEAAKFMQAGFSDWSIGLRTVGHMTADGVIGNQESWPFIDSVSDGQWL